MLNHIQRFPNAATVLILVALFITVSARAADIASTTAPTQTPRERALAFVAAGNQRAAEHLIEGLLQDTAKNHVRPHVEDVFFAAVCRRSRFEIQQAAPLFKYVNEANSFTTHGQAAGLILEIDSQKNVDADFATLDELWSHNQTDPLLLWMVAVQCRSLKKPDIGVNRYEMLCQLWNPGPVLVHQTYANLLDELHRSGEALVHRQMAVKIEPQYWSYDGLGNTLTALGRWVEADAAYAESTRLAPNQAWLWNNWAISKQARGDTAGMAELMVKVRELEKAVAARGN